MKLTKKVFFRGFRLMKVQQFPVVHGAPYWCSIGVSLRKRKITFFYDSRSTFVLCIRGKVGENATLAAKAKCLLCADEASVCCVQSY
jgi:hypothetical protein